MVTFDDLMSLDDDADLDPEELARKGSDIRRIREYFKARSGELVRCKVVSPDPEAGEGHYRVSCEKGCRYCVFVDAGKIHIKNRMTE